MKKTILVDMDDTIALLMDAIRKDHNDQHPDHILKPQDMMAFDDSILHPEYDKRSFFGSTGLFYNLELIDNHVVEEMQKIHEAYDLIIVTAAFSESVHDKWRWLQKHMPFIPHDNFCTFKRKDKIHGDILIDDAPHNLLPWTETGRDAICIKQNWNVHLKEHETPDGHGDIFMKDGWKGMKEDIDFLIERQKVREFYESKT